jgi:peptidoglycan/xylan/chitin deacetylase (PgdA/CDA1 family)
MSPTPIHHRLLIWSYNAFHTPKRFLRDLTPNSNQLRVLLFHDIPPAALGNFEEQIHRLSKSWRFISPEIFEAMILGREPIRGANLLLTFDDGFASNRIAAEQVLAPLNIKALFFVIADFVGLSGAGAAAFVRQRIFPQTVDLGSEARLQAMGWNDLEALLEQGHVIGAHTRTHARLTESVDRTELLTEVIGSADFLSARLGVKVDHFAYPFGNIESIDARSIAIARTRFRFIYSGLRGNNARFGTPYSVRRESLAAESLPSLTGALVEGFADFHYRSARRRLDRLGRQ